MNNFEIGSILIGKSNSFYAITNKNSLNIVVGNSSFNTNSHILGKNEIDVLVIARKGDSNGLGETYCVDAREFELVENFDVYNCIEHPGEYHFIQKDVLDVVLDEHNIKYNSDTCKFEIFTHKQIVSFANEKEFDVDVELTDDEKNAIINDVYEYLKSFGYQAKISGTTEVINTWLKQKRKLINMFKNHPNYNGKFQIVTEGEFDKKIEFGIVNEFKNWIKKLDVDHMYNKSIKLGSFTYAEALKHFHNLDLLVSLFNDCKINFINGHKKDFYLEQKRFFKVILDKYESNPDIVIVGENAYDKALYNKKHYLNIAIEFLKTDTLTHNATNYHVNLCNKYIEKGIIKTNTPMVEVFKLLFEKSEINNVPEFETRFEQLKNTLVSGKDQYYTILSIHPIDFLSIGHGTTWQSKEKIDKIYKLDKYLTDSDYCGITSSYMLDNSSMVFYTIKKDYEGVEFEKELKSHRNVFHYNDAKLLQDNMYPLEVFDGKSDVFEGSRHIVQNIIATCLNIDNKWVLKRGFDNYKSYININGKYEKNMFNNDYVNVSILKSTIGTCIEKIIIGAPNICFNCGKEFLDNHNIMCKTHKNPKVECKTCGKSYVAENCNYILDENPEKTGWYCKHHSFYCRKHKSFEIGQPASKNWKGESCEPENPIKINPKLFTMDSVFSEPVSYQTVEINDDVDI